MSSRRVTFECQVLQSKNWTVVNLYDDEASAIRAAEQELTRRAEGVRIIRNWQRIDGELAEKVVFEKQGDAKPLRDMRITPIETVNACKDEADFFSPESLATMGRLFRKYLDERRITPTEVLHLSREYQRIWDTESIVPAGVDRVALVQSRGTDQDSKSRGEEIYRVIEGIGARARRCERRRGLGKRVATSFGAVLAEDEIDRTFAATVVLARDLAKNGAWMAKLDRLGELIEAETDPEALAILDGVLAQLFGNREVLQDALGPQANLASACTTLIDVLEGGKGTFDRALPHRDMFVAQVRSGRLPQFRAALIYRLLRMIAGPGELSRNDRTRELVCFKGLANLLVGPGEILGGADGACALRDRAMQLIVEGGVTGRKLGLRRLLESLDGPVRRIRLLRVIDETLKCEPEVRVDAFEALRTIVASASTIRAFTEKTDDPIKSLMAAAELSRWLAATYPAKAVAPLRARLDYLEAKFLVAEQVIERIDRADLALPSQAALLLNFLLSGVLTEGKATALARERICGHLKRPDFVEAFAADCADAADKERKLREFHALLTRAGLSGMS